MLELLQEKNKGYIILANAGAFYLARGKDAVKLNEILGLKLLCMEPEGKRLIKTRIETSSSVHIILDKT